MMRLSSYDLDLMHARALRRWLPLVTMGRGTVASRVDTKALVHAAINTRAYGPDQRLDKSNTLNILRMKIKRMPLRLALHELTIQECADTSMARWAQSSRRIADCRRYSNYLNRGKGRRHG